MSGPAFHRIVGETSIHVWRDHVWAKPWHLIVRSDRGTGHRFFWTRGNAVAWATWLATIIGDALEAAETERRHYNREMSS